MLLRPELALLLFLLPGLQGQTSVTVKLPDDEDFKKYNFVYLSINGVQKIDGVSSLQSPDMFDVDRSSEQNRVVFRAALPNGVYQLDVTNAATFQLYQLRLQVERLPATSIDNSVFITGPTANVSQLLSRLRSLGTVRLISLVPVNSSSTEAAVQVYRPGTSDFLPLWEAYDLMRNETDGSSVQLMPDRCPVSAQLCRSRLTFSTGRPSAHPAVVQLDGSGINFLGFDLRWVAQTVDEMHAEPCGPATCLNGGSCDANFTGRGFRCICSSVPPNTPWGPRCEAPTRSYRSDFNQPLAFTRHWIGDLPRSAESLELSFEFAGTTQSEINETFVLKSSRNLVNPLLSVSLVLKTNLVKITGTLLGAGNSITFDEEKVNSGNWFVIHVLVKRDSVLAVLCAKHLPGSPGSTQKLECYKNSVSTITGDAIYSDFRNFWLEIGRALKGCVQSFAVNGYAVDLAAAMVITNDATRITTRCGYRDSSCRETTSPSAYACGDASVCYGFLQIDGAFPMNCNCKCLGSKRKQVETVLDSSVCKKVNPSGNVCNKDPLILNTISDAENYWVLNNSSRLLPVPSVSTASIEMELRTRNSSVSGFLTSVIHGSVTLRQQLKVSAGLLRLCISASCSAFPPIRVDDGEWHSVSATIKQSLLRLTVDGVSTLHVRGSNATGFNFMELSIAIANSCLRNIRVSGTYMSTNGTDNSVSPGVSVEARLAPDTSVSGEGRNPAPLCDSLGCPPTERCVRLWGATTCECQAGQERNGAGSCVAVNPCSKFGISCPSAGECRPASGDPGFECLCPAGVTSRLCVLGPPSSGAPAMAGVQWWIWLIVGIIALVLLIGLVISLILLRRNRSGAAAAARSMAKDPGREIEKIHEGMGADNEYDEVQFPQLRTQLPPSPTRQTRQEFDPED